VHEPSDPSELAAPPSGRSAALRPGTLREALDGSVEQALARRGAPPAGPAQPTDPSARVADQLARAKVVDAPGLCVVMPALRTLVDERGVLDLADSLALRAWSEMLTDQRVLMLFDRDDAGVPTLAPLPLGAVFERSELLAAASFDGPSDARDESGYDVSSDLPFEPRSEPIFALVSDDLAGDSELAPDDDAAVEADADADADVPVVLATLPRASDPLAVQHSRTLGLLFEALVDDEDELGSMDPGDGEPQTCPMEAMACEPAVPDGGLFDPDAASPLSPLQGASQLTHGDPGLVAVAEHVETAPARDAAPTQEKSARPARRLPGRRAAKVESATPERGAMAVLLDHDTCARYARELEAAAGPQPVRVIEQLYRTRYVPLLETLSVGLEHEAARRAVDGWRKVFTKSYGEGFMAIRLTAKRPPMVLDAPEMAARIARTHGAKSAEMLLVDGLRYDLGLRVNRLLSARMGSRAVCADEGLLWSALPTVTPVQMRLLARGPSALKDSESMAEGEAIVQRGRSAQTLRRVRIGSRDLIKLDIVEARLREAGGAFDERMADIADTTAKTIAEVMSTLAPGTLLYVFGDHGFRMNAGATDERNDGMRGTPAATQGGASPEEVLVPAFAWLMSASPSQAN
jgi:hypothetical protein